MTNRIQPARFAGSWYPNDPEQLHRALSAAMKRTPIHFAHPPKLLIMPHAGFRFSGEVAARVAASIGGDIKRVVLIGPSHRFAFQGVAAPDADAFATPFGDMPVDHEALKQLGQNDITEPRAFENEHSIEVLLPHIFHKLGAVPIVPLVVGDADQATLVRLLEALWGDAQTLIVISTDLSHFLPANATEPLDLATAEKLERLDASGWSGQMACGYRPLSAAIAVAAKRGLRMTRIHQTHSGAITGDMSRVVGYGGWVGHDIAEAEFDAPARSAMLNLAARAAAHQLKTGRRPVLNVKSCAVPLQTIGASFVTLSQGGALRGCIGSLVAHRPLAEDVFNRALDAAFKDPRFSPLTKEEFARTDIEISVLSPSAEIAFNDEQDLLSKLIPHQDGLILQSGKHRGTFLPKVWESFPAPQDFLNRLKNKAGLPQDYWADDLKIWRYKTESFGNISLAAALGVSQPQNK